MEQSYRSPLARPLIGPGDVHLENPDLRAAVLKPLGREAKWESVIASDIMGRARELDDRIGGDYKNFRLAQSTATAIFMYSHSGGGKVGLNKPWLDVVLTGPEGPSRELVTDALDRMQKSLFYLYENGTWVFRAQPNLNAVLSNELAQVDTAKATELIHEYARKVAGRGTFRPILWPQSHKDVPDDNTLKLVVYGPGHADETPASKQIRDLVQQNAPGGPRVNKNTLVHLFLSIDEKPGLVDLAKQEIALENIEHRSSSLALNEEQERELAERLRRVRSALPERTRAACSELYEPIDGKGGFRYRKIKHIVQSENTLVAAVESVLQGDDRLLDKLDPALITHGDPPLWPKNQDFLPLSELRDYFFRLPELPMLAGSSVLERTIVEGIEQGLFELAIKEPGGYKLVHWSNHPPKTVYFSENYALVRPGVLMRPKADAGDVAPVPVAEQTEDACTPTPTQDSVELAGPARLRIVLKSVRDEQIPTLLDLIQALRDAGGVVAFSAELVAVNEGRGLDANTLSLTVRELLEQHGIEFEWEEDRG